MMTIYDESPTMRGMYPSRQTWRAAVRAAEKEQAARERSEAKHKVHLRTKARQLEAATSAPPRGRVIPLVNVIGRGGSRIMRQLIGDKLYRMG